MKGKQHFGINIIILVTLVMILLIIDMDKNMVIINFITNSIGIFGAFAFIYLFLISSLLPDSDSEDSGSFIFYTYSFLFGWLLKLVEFPLAKLLKRERGHRGSLHTVVGISITSIIVAGLISWLLHLMNGLKSYTIFFLFLAVFLGQLLHVIGDWHFKLK